MSSQHNESTSNCRRTIPRRPLVNAVMRQAGGLELIPAVLAVILFVSPWAFGFTAVTALAWSAWIVAILVVLALGSMFTMQNRRAMA